MRPREPPPARETRPDGSGSPRISPKFGGRYHGPFSTAADGACAAAFEPEERLRGCSDDVASSCVHAAGASPE